MLVRPAAVLILLLLTIRTLLPASEKLSQEVQFYSDHQTDGVLSYADIGKFSFGRLISASSTDLRGRSRRKLEATQRRYGSAPEAYVDVDDARLREVFQEVLTKEGKRIDLVNRYAYIFNLAEVQWGLETDESIRAKVADERWGAFYPPGIGIRYSVLAAQLHIDPMPELYIDSAKKNPLSSLQAAAAETREGRPYVLLSGGIEDRLDYHELTAVLAHELAHIRNKDTHPENILRALGDRRFARKQEREADLVGVGANGTCDPRPLARALVLLYKTDLADYLKENPEKTEADYSLGADNERYQNHETVFQRILRLDQMVKKPTGVCKAIEYLRQHNWRTRDVVVLTTSSPEERRAN